jgi:hypothetical protein
VDLRRLELLTSNANGNWRDIPVHSVLSRLRGSHLPLSKLTALK